MAARGERDLAPYDEITEGVAEGAAHKVRALELGLDHDGWKGLPFLKGDLELVVVVEVVQAEIPAVHEAAQPKAVVRVLEEIVRAVRVSADRGCPRDRLRHQSARCEGKVRVLSR